MTRLARISLLCIVILILAAVSVIVVACGSSSTTTSAPATTTTAAVTTTTAASSTTAGTAATTTTAGAAAQTVLAGTTVPEGSPWVDTTKFKKAPPWNIGVSMPSLGDEWLVYYLELIKYWADQHKDLVSGLTITEGQADPVKQINDYKDLVTKGVDAIISTPVTPAANPGQNYAYSKGVPVVQVVRTGGTEQFTAQLVNDEVDIGNRIMTWLAEKMGGKGNIVVFSGAAGSWPSEGRLIGMKQVLANYPDIKIVGGPVYTTWAAAPAKKAMEDWISAGIQIDGIWADSGMMALPALETWLAAGKKPIPAVGDSYNGWMKFVVKNNLQDVVGSINTIPLYSGVVAIETVTKILSGESVPRTAYFTTGEFDVNKWVRNDLSDAYFAQDYIEGSFTPPDDLKLKIFALKK